MRLSAFLVLLLTVSNLEATYRHPAYYQRVDSLKTILRQGQDPSEKIDVYLELSELVFDRTKDTAMAYIDSAEVVAQKYSLHEKLAMIYIERGQTYSQLGDYTTAVDQFVEAIRFIEESGKKGKYPAWPYIDIGNFFFEITEYEKAIDFYLRGAEIFAAQKYDYGISVALNNIGLAQLSNNRDSLAYSTFTKAASLRRNENSSMLAHTQFYMAETAQKLGKEKLANSLLSQANSGLENGKGYKYAIDVMSVAVKVNILMHQYETARKWLKEYLALNIEKGEEHRNIDAYLLFAQLERKAGNYARARDIAVVGLGLAQGSERLILEEEYLEELKQIHHLTGDLKETVEISNQLLDLKDSLQLARNSVLVDILQFRQSLFLSETENKELLLRNQTKNEELAVINNFLTGVILLASALIILLVIIFRINSKRRKSEKLARESHQRLLTIINNTSNIIISLSADGRVRLLNHAAEDFYESLVGVIPKPGENLIDLFSEEGHRQIWRDWINRTKTEGSFQQVSEVDLDGELHYIYKNFSPLFDVNGEFDGMVMVGADFSENQRQEKEITRQKDELNRANKAKEKLISILAHDLKDTIFSTRALAEMVVESPESHSKEELQNYFELLLNNFRSTGDMLNGLLAWVKTQTSGMYLKTEAISVQSMVEDVCKVLEDRRAAKSVDLSINIDKDYKVLADAEMLRTIFRNLISNAIKYTHPVEGKIEVYCRDAGSELEIVIHDNGLGISDVDLEKIRQRPGSTSRPGTNNERGTGFGLSLCIELLRIHKSELQVQSEPGHGSTFLFRLPKSEKEKKVSV